MEKIPEKKLIKQDGISGPKRNGLSVVVNINVKGIPYLETIASVLPIADEIVVREGGNNDDVYSYITKFEENYPEINWQIYQSSDYPACINQAPHSKLFNEQRYGENEAIRKASNSKVLLLKPGESLKYRDLKKIQVILDDRAAVFQIKEYGISEVVSTKPSFRLAENEDLFSDGLGLVVDKGNDVVMSDIVVHKVETLDANINGDTPEVWEGVFENDYKARSSLFNQNYQDIKLNPKSRFG